MQGVAGVDYAALNICAAVAEGTDQSAYAGLATLSSEDAIVALPDRIDPIAGTPQPAQLVVLSRAVPSLLMLSEVPHD